jgi:hypothetical protein
MADKLGHPLFSFVNIFMPSSPALSVAQITNRSPTTINYADYFSGVAPQQNFTTDQISSTGVSNLSFPSDLPIYYITLKYGDLDRTNINQPLVKNTIGQIVLPLPQNLLDSQHVIFEAQPVGLGGAIAAQAATGGGLSGALSSSLTAATAQAAQNALKTINTISSLSQGTLAGLGLTLNQWLIQILKSPDYKSWEMTWRLSPKNETEAATLNQIIRVLNDGAAPQLPSGGASLYSGFFGFPCVWDVAIQYALGQFNSSPTNGCTQNWLGTLFPMKTSIIDQISVNYSPAGLPSFNAPKNSMPPSPINCRYHHPLYLFEFLHPGGFWVWYGNHGKSHCVSELHKLHPNQLQQWRGGELVLMGFTVEDCRKISIQTLWREQIFRLGHSVGIVHGVKFTTVTSPHGSYIHINGKSWKLDIEILKRSQKSPTSKGREIEGFRWYVLDGNGKRHTDLLLTPDGQVGCRSELGIGYRSQREIPRKRDVRRKQKIMKRLMATGTIGEPPPRKPGMHRKTYQKLNGDLQTRATSN